jgi:uncharacterized phiE125 gp8 family phage protein
MLIQTGTPASEPITLAEARVHLRLDGNDEDALVAAWIVAARQQVEAITGRALMVQDWELRLPCFPAGGGCIELPYPPLVEVVSLTTVAADGTETALDPAAYQVDAPAGPTAQPARVYPRASGYWPSTAGGVRGAVRVAYQAGYASASQVPQPLRAALLLAVGDLYANREASGSARLQDNPTFKRLVQPYRVFW